jgi:hypothetical protein
MKLSSLAESGYQKAGLGQNSIFDNRIRPDIKIWLYTCI